LDWKVYVTTPKDELLKLCRVPLIIGSGYGYGWDDGEGLGDGWGKGFGDGRGDGWGVGISEGKGDGRSPTSWEG
jgi:hypothetical protein